MGWLPSLDSQMHQKWLDAAWCDVQLDAEAAIGRRCKARGATEAELVSKGRGSDMRSQQRRLEQLR
eukprot:4756274-Amphidinium_carterae.1